MEFFNTLYKPIFGKRIKSIRKHYGKKQKDFGNDSVISQIENGIRDINANILFNIKQSIGITYEEIIFNGVDEFVEDLFYYSFSSILLRDYDKISENYHTKKVDSTDKVVQKNCLELAKTFSDFNIKRRNFNLSDEKAMDHFNKESDFITLLNGQFYNPARDRAKPINEDTVIDFEKMSETLWLLLRSKLIDSFSNHVCTALFRENSEGYPIDFSLYTIDKKINLWWESIVATEIIPQLIRKLKKNPLFNIGFIVDEMLNKMVKDDIKPSHLSSVPMRFKKDDSLQIITSNESWRNLNDQEKEELQLAYIEVDKFFRQEITLEELHSKFSDDKLKSLGIKIHMQDKADFIEEITFDEVLQMVENPKAISTIKNQPDILQQLPIYDFTRKKLKELPTNLKEDESSIKFMETMELFGSPLDSIHVNRKIEGLLEENKAVVNYFQEQLNESILVMANKLNHIQQAFLTFLSKDELINWAL